MPAEKQSIIGPGQDRAGIQGPSGTDIRLQKKIAVYPGTFDPVTNGHIDVIKRALRLFDQIIVVISRNPAKTPLFTLEERFAMLSRCFNPERKRIEIDATDGLIVDYAASRQACALIRGLRAVSDFDYEFQLALMNRRLERRLDTVFLMPGFRWIYISSSIIKDAAKHGGDVSGLVPAHVQAALQEKYQQ